jgi:hypothetical protein
LKLKKNIPSPKPFTPLRIPYAPMVQDPLKMLKSGPRSSSDQHESPLFSSLLNSNLYPLLRFAIGFPFHSNPTSLKFPLSWIRTAIPHWRNYINLAILPSPNQLSQEESALIKSPHFWDSVLSTYFDCFHLQVPIISKQHFYKYRHTYPPALLASMYWCGYNCLPSASPGISQYLENFMIDSIKLVYFKPRLSTMQVLMLVCTMYLTKGDMKQFQRYFQHMHRIGVLQGLGHELKSYNRLICSIRNRVWVGFAGLLYVSSGLNFHHPPYFEMPSVNTIIRDVDLCDSSLQPYFVLTCGNTQIHPTSYLDKIESCCSLKYIQALPLYYFLVKLSIWLNLEVLPKCKTFEECYFHIDRFSKWVDFVFERTMKTFDDILSEYPKLTDQSIIGRTKIYKTHLTFLLYGTKLRVDLFKPQSLQNHSYPHKMIDKFIVTVDHLISLFHEAPVYYFNFQLLILIRLGFTIIRTFSSTSDVLKFRLTSRLRSIYNIILSFKFQNKYILGVIKMIEEGSVKSGVNLNSE